MDKDREPNAEHPAESRLLHAQEHKGYGSEQHWLDYRCSCGETISAESTAGIVAAVGSHFEDAHPEAEAPTREAIVAEAQKRNEH